MKIVSIALFVVMDTSPRCFMLGNMDNQFYWLLILCNVFPDKFANLPLDHHIQSNYGKTSAIKIHNDISHLPKTLPCR